MLMVYISTSIATVQSIGGKITDIAANKKPYRMAFTPEFL